MRHNGAVMGGSDIQTCGVAILGPDDVALCQPIFDTAYLDVHERHGLHVDGSDDADWLRLILTRFLDTDPAGSVIAKRDGEPVAFACSVRRDDYWFLSFLFVMPAWQGRGLGRRLLTRVLPTDEVVRATAVESFQSVSTGLYASFGMAPRSLKYWVTDLRHAERLPALPPSVTRTRASDADIAAIDGLDRKVLGFGRPADHAWWRKEGQACFSYRRGDDLVAYAYADGGFIGPALAVDQDVLSAAVADLIRTSDDPKTAVVNVSGDSDQLFRMLVEAGGRIDDNDVYRFVYCSSAGPLPSSYVHHSDWLP
jgi:GNAT superfamily N-acetyltransferase